MADLNDFLGAPIGLEEKETNTLDAFLGSPINREEDKEQASEINKYLAPVTEGPAPEGVRDLTRDDVFAKIAPYMKSKFGMAEDKFERQEIVDSYINHMRKFNFGQSVVTLGEFAYLKNASDVQKAEAAAAYQTFDSMKNAFAEGTSGLEKLDAVYDYGRALIVDPVNLVSFGVGKLLAGGGSKAAVQVAKEAVKREVADLIQRKGLTEGTKRGAMQLERKMIGQVLKNEVFEGVTKGAFREAAKKAATREAFYTGVSDTVAGVSMDAVYQQSMQEVGLQTEYNMMQGSLAAAGGLFGVGLSVGLAKLAKTGDPDTDMLGAMFFDRANTQLAEARKIAGSVGQTIDDLDMRSFQDGLAGFKDGIESFAEKVERGGLLRLMGTGQRVPKETQIRKAFYLGDPETGVKGLVDILAESGVRNWTKRSDDDNFSNWMMDLVKAMPDNVRNQIDDAFRNTLGKAVPDYNGKSLVQALDMDAKAFSVAGQQLNIMAQASKTLRYIKPDEPDEMLKELIKAETPAITQRVRQAFSEKTNYLQRNLIRMLVTHPGTTALNLIGWQSASTLQSTSDIIRGTLYGGMSLLQSAMFNRESAARYAKKAGLMFSLQKQKMMNMLDPHMTYEAFMDFAAYNPEAQKKMFRYMSGGIELEEVAKDLGFADFKELAKQSGVKGAEQLDTSKPGVFEKVMDGLQTVYGVKAQDMLTKTQEFMYAIDKRIRNEYGVTYAEFLRDPNLWSKMQGDKYAEIVSEASDDALRNVFAKQYGGTKGPLQFTAKVVEDVRKLPVLGAMIPFGQFFNNTLGHMFDHTGISLVHKYLAGTTRDPMELATKSAAGLTFIGAMYTYEKDYLDEGLPLFSERSSDGTIRNRQYDFPYSFYKAIGRMAAYVVRDGEIPRPVIEEIAATFGPEQLTRQLGDSVKASYELLLDLAESDDVNTVRALTEIVQKSASMYISGYTRPLDPVNQIAALTKGGPYVSPDRAQGAKWLNNSVRYVDELLGAMELYSKPEQKQRALAEEPDRLPIGRIFGFREELAQTPIQVMYNEAGLAQWRTNIRSNIKAPLNDINRIITPILNYHASDMMDSFLWKTADAAKRKELISTVVSDSKKTALEFLGASYDKEDRKSVLLYKLGQSSFIKKNELRSLLNDMDLGDDPSELDTEQLNFLITYIEMQKDIEKSNKKAYEATR